MLSLTNQVPRFFTGNQFRLKNVSKNFILFNNQRSNFITYVGKHEKGVTFTRGKISSVKEQGFRIRIPIFQWMWKADMRTKEYEDSIFIDMSNKTTVRANLFFKFRIIDPKKAIRDVPGVREKEIVKDRTYFQDEVEDMSTKLIMHRIKKELSSYDGSQVAENTREISKQLLERTQKFTNECGIELCSIYIYDFRYPPVKKYHVDNGHQEYIYVNLKTF